MTSLIDNFYCNQKFTWLSIDLEKRQIYSCCSATPERIDLKWLEANPGQLFATPNLKQERLDMLANTPVSSCKTACWDPESQGLPSRRSRFQSHKLTHTDVNQVDPQQLNIILGSTCNLTCSYCCKQYSTAWIRDIEKNGAYLDDPRFSLLPIDKIVSRLSQNEHQTTPGFNLLTEQISKFKNVKEVIITGGEPFLYNAFPDLVNGLLTSENVSFFTGLGVDSKRLEKQLNRIENKQMTAIVSAENCGLNYEFNRYNNSYQKFLENYTILTSHLPVKFSSVISNLTIHGLREFCESFGNHEISFVYCNDPTYLAVNVLDDKTKNQLSESLYSSQIKDKDKIISAVNKPCTENQRQQFASYVTEFAKRRQLSLDIFPPSLQQWLKVS